MDSDENLYRILGVEPGASNEAIRAAYRARVRENHSDGKQLSPEETARADERTAALNHAWGILCDPSRRRQYDEQREVEALLRRAPSHASDGGAEASGESTAAVGTRARSPQSVHASHLLRSRIVALPVLHWEKESCGGFEWALSTKSLLARYLVALRYEASADTDAARNFLIAARIAAESRQARMRHYLFVLMYDRASQLEQVRATCAHFCASDAGKGCAAVLYDAPRSRALLCSDAPSDGKTRSLLAALGV